MADSEKQQQLPIEQQQPLAQEEQEDDDGQQAQGKPAPPPKEIIGKHLNQFAFSFMQTHGECWGATKIAMKERNGTERRRALQYIQKLRKMCVHRSMCVCGYLYVPLSVCES